MVAILLSVTLLTLVFCLGAALGLWLTYRQSRRADRITAQRLDAEAQIEVATMRTLAAMREAARGHMRRSS